MTGDKESRDQEVTFLVAKAVTSMFIAAMPKIEFDSVHWRDLENDKIELPSSHIANSNVVYCKAQTPFHI